MLTQWRWQAEFEHGVLRKVKDALEEKVAALAGEVAEARVRTASLQKQLQAHAAHSHEVSPHAHRTHICGLFLFVSGGTLRVNVGVVGVRVLWAAVVLKSG